MVLLIAGRPISHLSGGSLLEAVLAAPQLQAACAVFLGSTAALAPGAALHVFQSECASLVPLAGPLRVLGSSDATTCVTTVLVDAAAGLAAVAHYDEATVQAPFSLAACLGGMSAPSLWLAGGYCDARGAGPRTAAMLLRHFHASPLPVSLQLCCVGAANTDAAGAPRAQSLAVDLRNGSASAPARFPDRGPLPLPRLAQLWLRDDASQLSQVWDAAAGRLSLPLWVGAVNPRLAAYLRHLLRLRPAEFLELVSTSPEHEGPGFLEDMKGAMDWLLRQTGPRRRATFAFRWGQDGWEPAGEPAGAGVAGLAAVAEREESGELI